MADPLLVGARGVGARGVLSCAIVREISERYEKFSALEQSRRFLSTAPFEIQGVTARHT